MSVLIPEPRPHGGTGSADAADPIGVYLREIGRTPLLTAAEELHLAAVVEAGRSEPCPDLAKQESVAAYRCLVESNLRLVPGIARHYLNRGLDLTDLIQEGNIGLMRAAQKFDHRRGFRFSTYAFWWIKQAIRRAVEERGRPIRLPSHIAEELRRIRGVQGRLQQELGRDATPAEIGALTDLSPERVDEFLALMQRPTSLDVSFDDEYELGLADRIADGEATDPALAAEVGDVQTELRQALELLEARERQVLELRFGLAGDNDLTLAEVGERLGISRERVRQVEIRAIKKLRFRVRSIRLASPSSGGHR